MESKMGKQVILCDGFEVVPPPDMSNLIILGSDHSVSNCDETIFTTEEDGTVFSGDSSPGDAAEDEWFEEKPFSFYFVKHHAFDDPDIKTKINEADQEIYRCNKLRIDFSNARESEKAEVTSLSAQLDSLGPKSEGLRVAFEEKRREFDSLHEALRSLRCSSSDQLCFTKEELDHLFYVAHYHIEYGSVGFDEEDWVLKKTEKPDGIILSEDSLAQKEASIHRVKSVAGELSEVKKELEATVWKMSLTNDKMVKSQTKMKVFDVELARILEKRDRSYGRIRMLRIQRDRGNAAFYKSLTVMRKAKELAASGNVSDLELFASSEVDGFMTHWNDDKGFRDAYVKRISLSLWERQLNRDGRIKAPEVQLVREKQPLVKTMKGAEEVHKKNREDSSSNVSQGGNVVTDKRKKETRKKAMDLNRASAEETDDIDMEFPVYEIPKKEKEEVDEETLKERKREEQLEKARLAMERKRKLQEKATAKAAIRAQKEAEKKLKECEKKAKKKAAAISSTPSESDQSVEVEKAKTSAVSGKEKHQKDRSLYPKQRSFRYKHRGRGTEALPKAILNRRKAHKYWVWGISSAALAVSLVLVVLLLR